MRARGSVLGRLRGVTAALVGALTLAACGGGGGGGGALHIYNWSDYIDPKILADFTRETGTKVVYDTFDSVDMLETKVLTGNSGYDIVVPSNQYVPRFAEAKAIQPLDQAKLPNAKNLWPAVMRYMAPFDPGAKYAVPYMWGTVGIGYNPDKVARALPGVKVDSWRVLFDPANLAKLKDCGVYFLADPQDMYGSALRFMGKDPNSKDPADYAAATDLLLKLRPYVRKFTNSENIEALANGDICIAIGYSGDMLQAASRAREANHGVTLAYAIPKEGSQVWFDSFTIPADAPNPSAAHAFINYMLRPDVIARASNATHYANANAAATPLLDKAVRDDPNVYLSPDTFARLYVVAPKDQALLREVNRDWTRVTTGQ
ncbi:polyamine ABC transporter substrate-binding protein [Caulobacter sp. KR2-114]|uniref:polyamine ABC transporter substrate-binding protein n=1 Tax=Caulobacter sp. KR2-114 TaxID=3400912 RepID=UPI003C0423A4